MAKSPILPLPRLTLKVYPTQLNPRAKNSESRNSLVERNSDRVQIHSGRWSYNDRLTSILISCEKLRIVVRTVGVTRCPRKELVLSRRDPINCEISGRIRCPVPVQPTIGASSFRRNQNQDGVTDRFA